MAPNFSARIAANCRRAADARAYGEDDHRQLYEAAGHIERLEAQVQNRVQELVNSGTRQQVLVDRIAELEAQVTLTPVADELTKSLLGEGIHTGLRRGSDADDAHDLWRAIQGSPAWSDALAYAVSGLDSMGFVLCERPREKAAVAALDTSKGEV